MPLYNNILSSKKHKPDRPNETPTRQSQTATECSKTSASMKLLHDHLQSKQRLQQQNNKATIKNLKTTKPHCDKIISESSLHNELENDWEPEDEYDPMVPNSYEVLQMEYLKAREQRLAEEKQAQLLAKSILKKPKANLLNVIDILEEDDYLSPDAPSTRRGTAIAPPPSLALSNTTNVDSNPAQDKPPHVVSASKAGGASIAAKIMSKMGYKAGSGLGKDEQGISSPLEVERTGVNSGRIVTFEDQKTSGARKQSLEKSDDKTMPADATRILLLQNMVGPGEVDDDLEAETKEECKKYGRVIKCLIYEIPNKKVPDDQAVRIFVEFEAVESTVRAVNDLNGRFFGGRVVKASFYNLARFNKFELWPERPTK